MAGVLFIVTIPTKEEESSITKDDQLSTDKIPTDPFQSPLKSSSTPGARNLRNEFSIHSESVPNLSPSAKDVTYGTFEKKCVHIKINDEEVQSDSSPAPRKSWEGFRDMITTRRTIRKKKEKHWKLDIPEDSCMEAVMTEILKKFKIENASWTKANDGKSYQIIFTIEFDEKYERILENFHEWGIGDREGSTVSVVNCNAFNTCSKSKGIGDDISAEKLNDQKESAWNRFMNSVAARLNVAQIVRDVRQEATITFDFVVLVTSAAILASFGLVEDSTIFLASSMLISPLMGPIIAAIFGTVIKDKSLRSLGVFNEFVGILIATFVGFVFGIIVCSIEDRYGEGEGLTTEIISRCELHSLLVGIFTAIPSGAAAAIGILGGNIGSLVGVAISASLLPPAVNSGLLWALACLYKLYESDGSRFNYVTKTNFYSDNQALELAILGMISMCLTISNVICVYVMGILVLKAKEVAPVISRNNREFWKHDIKIARDFNKNGFDKDTAIIDEFAALPKEDQEALGLNYDFLRTINLEDASYQNTWSPVGNRNAYEKRENYTTIHKFERLYNNSAMAQNNVPKIARGSLSIPMKPHFSVALRGSDINPRRASMPTELFFSKSKNVIQEGDETSSTGVPSDGGRRKRKFIVTPVV